MIKTRYLPRQKELHVEFDDGSVAVYEDVRKDDIRSLTQEAIKNHKETLKQQRH